MTVVNWLASDTTSWIFFSFGLLIAALAIVDKVLPAGSSSPHRPVRPFFRNLSAWSPVVVGPLLLLGGAVLAGTGEGQISWVNMVSGAVCLFTFAHLLLLEQFRNIRLDVRALRELHDDLPLRTSREVQDLTSRQFADQYDRILFAAGRYARSTQEVPTFSDKVYRTPTEPAAPKFASFEEFATSMVRRGAWATASIYTDDDDGGRLRDAVEAVLREFALATAVEEPAVRGSWFQRFWVRSRELAGSEPVRERLAKLEEAVHLEHLGKRRAEIDKTKSESVAALIEAIKEQDNAIVRIGSILVIKAQGDLVVWTISEMEAAAIEKNSDLLSSPVAALKFLRTGELQRDSIGLESPEAGPHSDSSRRSG